MGDGHGGQWLVGQAGRLPRSLQWPPIGPVLTPSSQGPPEQALFPPDVLNLLSHPN